MRKVMAASSHTRVLLVALIGAQTSQGGCNLAHLLRAGVANTAVVTQGRRGARLPSFQNNRSPERFWRERVEAFT
jgi:hypothetical protein